MAKCNLVKVNLELMLPAVSPSLLMIRGGAPLEFAGANYVQPCLIAIVAITASVSESLRIHTELKVPPSPNLFFKKCSIKSRGICVVWKFIDGAVTCTLDVWNMTCMMCIDPPTIYNITT